MTFAPVRVHYPFHDNPKAPPLSASLIQLDHNIFHLINGQWHHPALDAFFSVITDFSLFEIPLAILAVVLFAIAKPRLKYAIVLLILSVVIADMIGQDLKTLFERLRPYFVFDDVRFPGEKSGSKSFSFPSNHAINMFAAMTVLAWEFRAKGWLALLFFIPAALVAYSRVYVGVHFPSDVLGGAVIGISCSAVILALDHFFPFVRYRAEEKKVVLNWLGITLLVMLFATIYRYSVISRDALPMAAEECQYWDWSRRLDLSYYSKPPLIAYLIRFFTTLFGSTPFGIRSTAVTLSLGVGIVTFLFTRELYRDDRVTFFTLVTMNVVPLFALGAIIITTDTPLMFFWAATVYTLYLAAVKERRIFWYISGVLFGFGLLSKYAMVYLPLCLAVFLAVSPEQRKWLRRPEPYLFLLIGAFMFTPVIVWSWQHGWVNFLHVAGQAKVDEGFHLSPGDLAGYVFGQMGVVTPLVFLAMAFFTWNSIKSGEWRTDPRQAYLLSMGLPVYLLLLVKSVQGPVLDNWAAPAYYTWLIFGVQQFDQHLRKAPSVPSFRRRVAYGSLALLLPTLLFLLIHDRAVFRSLQKGVIALNENTGLSIETVKIDPAYTMMGYDQLGEKVSKMLGDATVVMRPGRTFLVTQRYQIAAALAFYVKGQPNVYTLNFGDRRMNQYDLWGTPGAELEGWDAIYVTAGNGDDLEKEVAGSFRSVKRIPPIMFEWKDLPYREFTIYVCKGYTGSFPLAVKHSDKY